MRQQRKAIIILCWTALLNGIPMEGNIFEIVSNHRTKQNKKWNVKKSVTR